MVEALVEAGQVHPTSPGPSPEDSLAAFCRSIVSRNVVKISQIQFQRLMFDEVVKS